MTTTAAESIRIRITESSQPKGLPSALPNHGPEEYVALLASPDHPEVGPLLLESRSAPVEPAASEGAGTSSSVLEEPEAGATATGGIPEAADEPHPRELTREEGQRLLNERARRYLGMSGEEFRRRYEAGDLDPDNDNVLRVAMLLPLGR
jgi:hypothetical protein